jgi:dTDP-4-amino-4,6-dideoxygalactose transaminase
LKISLNQPLKPDITKLTKYLEKVNDSGWYTNFGPLHAELTRRLEEYLGVNNLLLVSNGTLALQVAYKTLNVKIAITTPFSFIATSSSLVWEGIDISFSDINSKSYNLDPNKVKIALDKNKQIDTVVATHVYGNPCDLSSFERISKSNNVKVIYDAAHAFNVKVNGSSILNFGDASTLSFHATKLFHTVEGGAIIFKDKTNFEHAKAMINFGIGLDGKVNDTGGINAKLNEYQCAVGLVLLDDIERTVAHRVRLFEAYRDGLSELVELPEWYENSTFNGAYMPIKFENEQTLEIVQKFLISHDIESRRYFTPSLDQVFTSYKVHGNFHSNRISKSILCLPLHFYMSLNDVSFIVDVIKKCLLKDARA